MTSGCNLCGDFSAAMFLHARCHPAAPLMAKKEGNELILSCYLPECGREVVRLRLADHADVSTDQLVLALQATAIQFEGGYNEAEVTIGRMLRGLCENIGDPVEAKRRIEQHKIAERRGRTIR